MARENMASGRAGWLAVKREKEKSHCIVCHNDSRRFLSITDCLLLFGYSESEAERFASSQSFTRTKTKRKTK